MKIHTYAADGNYSRVRNELEKGIPVDVKDEQEFTPLAHAVSSPKADKKLLRLLLDAGADANAVIDHSKKDILSLAACSGDLAKVQLMLDAGANIRFKSPKGYTVLTTSCTH